MASPLNAPAELSIPPLSPAPPVPTQPRGRAHPRFFIPDPSPAGHPPSSGQPSRRGSLHSIPPSLMTSPTAPAASHRRLSRASIAQLRSALQMYHVRSPDADPYAGAEPVTPPPRPAVLGVPHYLDSSTGYSTPAVSALDLREHGGARGWEPSLVSDMDALVEIHRVLYRGREDLGVDTDRRLPEQGQEVRRVVERWFEGDCVYEHPLLRLGSRQSLLAHVILLHLVATVSLPSLTPSALLSHVRSITHRLKNILVGEDDTPTAADIEAGRAEKGKGKKLELDWEAGDEKMALQSSSPTQSRPRKHAGAWWTLWDVGAECMEIGGMECYGGTRLAMIEHVISLTIFPTLLGRRSSDSALDLSPPYSSISLPSLGVGAPSQTGFVTKLLKALASEFDYMLKWELPVSTMVEFNEVGKATRMRDIVDVRDVIETFVPFAKRIGWVTRRLTGLVTSTMGSIAMSFIPALPPPIDAKVAMPIKVEAEKMAEKHARSDRLGSAIGLGFQNLGPIPPPVKTEPVPAPVSSMWSCSEERPNTLGLQGVDMAPDVDSEGFEL